MTEAFDRWVSIGNNCMAKYQINRYISRKFFGLDENSALKAHQMTQGPFRNRLRDINGGNLLFDWVYIEDYNKVCNLLESGLNYNLPEESMERFAPDEDGPRAVRCNASGIHWVHLFSDRNSLADWTEQLPDLRPKIDHMRKEFLKLRDYSTLYVLASNHEGFENTEFPEKIHHALATLRHGSDRKFKLLICTPGATPRNQGDIIVRPFLPGGGAPWFGDAESWDRAFSDFALSMESRLNSTLDQAIANEPSNNVP